MADLYNLLDGIDDDDDDNNDNENEQQQLAFAENETGSGADNNPELQQQQEEGEEWTQHDRNDIELPHALAEARRKLYDSTPDDDKENNENYNKKASALVEDDDDDYYFNKQHKNDNIYNDHDNNNDEGEMSFYDQLKRLWTQEMYSPELLPFDEDLIATVMNELQKRQDEMEQMELDHESSGNGNINSLLKSILQVDMDRMKYILHDLLRTRLHKIQKFPLYMRQYADRMCEQEINFLKGYGQLLEKHLNLTVLDHIPKDAWRRLDEPHMIEAPDLNQYVFIKVIEEEGVEINNAASDDDAPNLQQFPKGSCLITRYNLIQPLFSQAKIELL